MGINATQSYLYGAPQPLTASAKGAQAVSSASAPAKDDSKDDDGFSFWDLIDVINPLQHIPVISSIYRDITGDTIKQSSQITGDIASSALIGGPIGLLTGVLGAVFEGATGTDPVTMVYNAITGGDDANATEVADNTPKTDTATAATAANSNQAALMQLASDMRGGSSPVNALDNDASAGQVTDFVKKLQTAPVNTSVMPKPAPQFMRPGSNPGLNAALTSSAVTGKPKTPTIDIYPAQQSANDTNNPNNGAPTPVPNSQVADQMMHAMDAYQKMQNTDGNPFPEQHLPSGTGF